MAQGATLVPMIFGHGFTSKGETNSYCWCQSCFQGAHCWVHRNRHHQTKHWRGNDYCMPCRDAECTVWRVSQNLQLCDLCVWLKRMKICRQPPSADNVQTAVNFQQMHARMFTKNEYLDGRAVVLKQLFVENSLGQVRIHADQAKFSGEFRHPAVTLVGIMANGFFQEIYERHERLKKVMTKSVLPILYRV